MDTKSAPLVVDGETYSIGRINPIVSMKLVLKLAPLMRGMPGVDVNSLMGETSSEKREAAFSQAIGSLLNGLGDLSEQTVDEVMSICLSVVQRQLPGGTGWAPVWAKFGTTGRLMYEDISLPSLMKILGRVLMDNLLSFTSALPRSVSGDPSSAS